ncbi:copper resistance CopC family protein [Planococcus dechangensis]|uniref:Copper resistance protein CopC n=1 Tax=Planococcus dechangensis TaxID=1176255 RepID=A0ABV9ME57_9BACL
MKKTLLLLSAFLILPMTAQAHSVLEASTPTDGEVVTEQLDTIALDFSAGIEQGSSMTMTMDGEAVDFSEVAVMDDQLIGTPAQELLDGSYVVEYAVLSEDGHPIEGTMAFELEAGVTEQASAEAEDQEAEQQAADEAAEEQSEAVETEASEEAAASEQATPTEQSGSNVTLIIAGLAVVLLIGAFVLMRKKR